MFVIVRPRCRTRRPTGSTSSRSTPRTTCLKSSRMCKPNPVAPSYPQARFPSLETSLLFHVRLQSCSSSDIFLAPNFEYSFSGFGKVETEIYIFAVNRQLLQVPKYSSAVSFFNSVASKYPRQLSLNHFFFEFLWFNPPWHFRFYFSLGSPLPGRIVQLHTMTTFCIFCE